MQAIWGDVCHMNILPRFIIDNDNGNMQLMSNNESLSLARYSIGTPLILLSRIGIHALLAIKWHVIVCAVA